MTRDGLNRMTRHTADFLRRVAIVDMVFTGVMTKSARVPFSTTFRIQLTSALVMFTPKFLLCIRIMERSLLSLVLEFGHRGRDALGTIHRLRSRPGLHHKLLYRDGFFFRRQGLVALNTENAGFHRRLRV